MARAAWRLWRLDGYPHRRPRGEIFGFGPNGAGKTTTLKILMGLVRATSGTALAAGTTGWRCGNAPSNRLLPESPYFTTISPAEEFFGFYGRLAGLNRGNHAAGDGSPELVGLVDARTRQLRKFSKGMLQRVGLAQALIHDPGIDYSR